MTLGGDAFNLFNAVNDNASVGTITSPLFGRPVTALGGARAPNLRSREVLIRPEPFEPVQYDRV